MDLIPTALTLRTVKSSKQRFRENYVNHNIAETSFIYLALLLYFFCNLSESLILVWLFIKTITRGIKGAKKTGHDIEQRNREKSSTFSHELEVETIYIVMLRLE